MQAYVFRLALFYFALLVMGCGAAASSKGTLSGQVSYDAGSGKGGLHAAGDGVSLMEGVTCDLISNGQTVMTDTTDSYGRYRFTDVTPGTYQVRVQDAARGIGNTYDVDFAGHRDVSLYCMLTGAAASYAYSWAYEYADMWVTMMENFDGMLDSNDLQNFWDQAQNSWNGMDMGRISLAPEPR